MALSTRAKLAGLGGALALGVLGATGAGYAAHASDTTGTGTGTSYVTTVDGTATTPSEQAPGSAGRDCPEKNGGSGGPGGPGGSEASPAPSGSGSTDGAADA